MNSNTPPLLLRALEMLTRRYANSPGEARISPELVLAPHDLFKVPNGVCWIPRSVFFKIHEQISTSHTHTHTQACRWSVHLQLLLRCIHCPVSKAVSVPVSTPVDRLSILLLTGSLSSSGSDAQTFPALMGRVSGFWIHLLLVSLINNRAGEKVLNFSFRASVFSWTTLISSAEMLRGS